MNSNRTVSCGKSFTDKHRFSSGIELVSRRCSIGRGAADNTYPDDKLNGLNEISFRFIIFPPPSKSIWYNLST